MSVMKGVGIKRILAGFGGLALALAVAGCSLNTDLRRPEKARIKIEGPSSGSIDLITSQNFLVIESEVTFVEADTTRVSTPFEKVYGLGIPARLYVKGLNAGDQTESFPVKILIGGESWYNETKTLEPGEAFEFVYRYNEPSING